MSTTDYYQVMFQALVYYDKSNFIKFLICVVSVLNVVNERVD